MGQDNTVSIATPYRLEGRRIESWWGAIFFAPAQDSPGAHPASHTIATGSFSTAKWLGHGLDHQPPPSPEVKERVQL
jgi:hypothetical protein